MNIRINDYCCEESLNEEEVELLHTCFESSSEITALEWASLYYIPGYIAMKEGMGLDSSTIGIEAMSVFT